jgi:hypothetical protein
VKAPTASATGPVVTKSAPKAEGGANAATASACPPGPGLLTASDGNEGEETKPDNVSATGPVSAVRAGNVGAGAKAPTESATCPGVIVSAPKADAGEKAPTLKV